MELIAFILYCMIGLSVVLYIYANSDDDDFGPPDEGMYVSIF